MRRMSNPFSASNGLGSVNANAPRRLGIENFARYTRPAREQ